MSAARPPAAVRDLVTAAAAAAVTGSLWQALRRGPVPGGRQRWARTNHAGAEVTLLEGVAWTLGSALTAAGAAGVARGAVEPAATRAAATATAAVVLATGAVGALDDLRQDTDRKGLAGHLGALLHGRVTTGALKILVLSGAGLGGVWWSDRAARATGRAGVPGPLGVLAGAGVVAGAANLANLLDLRPGRALKAGLLAVGPVLLGRGLARAHDDGSPAAAVTLGASLAVLADDLAGRSMLGDTGANPLGAAVGLALVQRQGTPARCLSLALVTALTLASERVSFSAVIDRTPVLRELDRLGRHSATPPAA